MECNKLSADACVHAVQNERLPLRVVVQVLFLEQIRATSSGSGGGSSRSTTTNTEDYWDAMPTVEEFKAMKGELGTLRLRDEGNVNDGTKTNDEKIAHSKVKRVLVSKQIFSKLWSNKERQSDHSSSDLSEDLASTQETKSDSFKK